jgi:hypothetical protein
VRHELFAPTNGLSNIVDNELEWNSSLWVKSLAKLDSGCFLQPERRAGNPKDGRENQDAPSDVLRVLREELWYDGQILVWGAFQGGRFPPGRVDLYGCSIVRSCLLQPPCPLFPMKPIP